MNVTRATGREPLTRLDVTLDELDTLITALRELENAAQRWQGWSPGNVTRLLARLQGHRDLLDPVPDPAPEPTP